jgi:CAAX prenyl protease-like protein
MQAHHANITMPNQQTLARTLPFALYILILLLVDLFAPMLTNMGIDAKWMYVFRLVAVLIALLYFAKQYVELAKLPPLSDFFYAAVAGIIVFVIRIFPYSEWMGGIGAAEVNPIAGYTELEPVLWVSVRLMGAALLVPIMEELFWRSYLMRWFDRSDFMTVNPERITIYAYVGSACLFALENRIWFAGLFAGLVYGELYKTYKNLWIPIFAHAVTNGVLGVWLVVTGHWQYW